MLGAHSYHHADFNAHFIRKYEHNRASVSKSLLIMLMCMPHTVGRECSGVDRWLHTVNLTQNITCNMWIALTSYRYSSDLTVLLVLDSTTHGVMAGKEEIH